MKTFFITALSAFWLTAACDKVVVDSGAPIDPHLKVLMPSKKWQGIDPRKNSVIRTPGTVIMIPKNAFKVPKDFPKNGKLWVTLLEAIHSYEYTNLRPGHIVRVDGQTKILTGGRIFSLFAVFQKKKVPLASPVYVQVKSNHSLSGNSLYYYTKDNNWLLEKSQAPENAAAAFTGRISGLVKDGKTGARVKGAQVILKGAGQRTETDQNGKFIFNSVYVGPAQVLVTSKPHNKRIIRLTVHSGKKHSTQILLSRRVSALRQSKDDEDTVEDASEASHVYAVNKTGWWRISKPSAAVVLSGNFSRNLGTLSKEYRLTIVGLDHFGGNTVMLNKAGNFKVYCPVGMTIRVLVSDLHGNVGKSNPFIINANNPAPVDVGRISMKKLPAAAKINSTKMIQYLGLLPEK